MRRRLKFHLDTSIFGSLFDFDDPRRIRNNEELNRRGKEGNI